VLGSLDRGLRDPLPLGARPEKERVVKEILRRLAQDVRTMIVLGVIFSILYIVASLLIYGRVDWV